MATPLVLVISRHQAFAEAVRRQLVRLDSIVEIVSPDDFARLGRPSIATAEVAFVDLDAQTPDGVPLYRSVAGVAKDCQVILVCHPKDTPAAAEAARRWEVFDYMLVDSVVDPYRTAMLVERARTHCLPELPEIHAQEKRHHRQILSMLVEMRAILKSRGDHPVVDAISRYKAGGSSLSAVDGGWLAGVYEHCLIDVICGRLKRLEDKFQSSYCERERDDTGTVRPKILLVEDNEICADMAQHILESHGLDVTVASTAETAKIALERQVPSLIVMDVHLGATNGLRLVEAVRHGGQCPNVPVIVCSADRMAATVQLAARLDVQEYLVKPYVPSVLVSKVKGVLARTAMESLLAERESATTAT
jgi:CheY-like chemotaxis protein